jgi:hypothetical protein
VESPVRPVTARNLIHDKNCYNASPAIRKSISAESPGHVRADPGILRISQKVPQDLTGGVLGTIVAPGNPLRPARRN